MRFDLEFLPMVSTAAGVLAGLDLKHRCIVVDHLTIGRVNPAQWDQVFLLAAETTFKIRPEMEMIGEKLVVIATSKEPGLNRWPYVFFPHWLTMIKPSQRPGIEERKNEFFYDALLGIGPRNDQLLPRWILRTEYQFRCKYVLQQHLGI